MAYTATQIITGPRTHYPARIVSAHVFVRFYRNFISPLHGSTNNGKREKIKLNQRKK